MLSVSLQDNLVKAADEVRSGVAFSRAMSRHGLTTAVAQSMMAVAERSGSLSDMLDVVAAFHEQELARWVDWFSRLFEPILMAVIGIVIGLVVVFMYMPVFELAETIQ
jgi:general secretion pathway protein F